MADEATTTETADGGNGTTTASAGKTFTQDDLDRIVGERVAKERQKFSDYDDLKTKASEFDKVADAQKSEAQKAIDKAAKETQRADAAEQRLLRHEVAAAKKLPADALDLLHGSTREELEAQADRILTLTQTSRSGFDGGVRGTTAPGDDMNQQIRRAAGRT